MHFRFRVFDVLENFIQRPTKRPGFVEIAGLKFAQIVHGRKTTTKSSRRFQVVYHQ